MSKLKTTSKGTNIVRQLVRLDWLFSTLVLISKKEYVIDSNFVYPDISRSTPIRRRN